jgi:hypothetical protein
MANREEFSNGDVSMTLSRRKSPLKFQGSWAWVVLVVAASIALAACGGPSSPSVANEGSTSTTSTVAKAGGTLSSDSLAFAQCMRSNGVRNFPDPNSSGQILKESPQQLGVSVARYQSALTPCVHFLPNGGSGPNQSQLQYVRTLSLNFARCMRSHGVPLPDPDSSGRIPDPASVGINQGSPTFEAANNACAKYRPPYMPSNAQYNNYVNSNG